MPTQKDKDRYESDPIDGLRRAIVGDWAPEKHLRLQKYVDITRAVRRKFGGNATYIDLYCGPGRARMRQTGEVGDGSALVAAIEAGTHVPFREIIIGDLDPVNVDACEARLKRLASSPVRSYRGTAEDAAIALLPTLNPTGFNLAFLDPFNIEALPFSVIQTNARAGAADGPSDPRQHHGPASQRARHDGFGEARSLRSRLGEARQISGNQFRIDDDGVCLLARTADELGLQGQFQHRKGNGQPQSAPLLAGARLQTRSCRQAVG